MESLVLLQTIRRTLQRPNSIRPADNKPTIILTSIEKSHLDKTTRGKEQSNRAIRLIIITRATYQRRSFLLLFCRAFCFADLNASGSSSQLLKLSSSLNFCGTGSTLDSRGVGPSDVKLASSGVGPSGVEASCCTGNSFVCFDVCANSVVLAAEVWTSSAETMGVKSPMKTSTPTVPDLFLTVFEVICHSSVIELLE
ncbi:hypothetical protein NCAS_0E01800 [Naumovozyma castellii]|uniref:Uncharacterized protein n=1 Tax=Naumovozyma castellii TaxID=27288 RepID=G0VFI4_NAUCA|nr:hypothetical protein NCAS_0E01800 [Naumovozyma castellii CBS 4309]CCC70250.1 hypothetical protein NCAS_0E01800 [Naumovozyma castellii CBS 4309]